MRRTLVLAAAAGAYLIAAWSVAPGFYDGFAPPQPYNFVCPPPQAGANLPPESGQLVINVIDGVSDSNIAFTKDGQITIAFFAGAFNATGKTSVIVNITPVSPCPNPSGLHFSTNTYLITADSPLAKETDQNKWPTLVMVYSNVVADPSYVYRAQSVDGPWTNIGSSLQARIWTKDTRTDQLGYFAAGYPSNALSKGGGAGNQILPITVAVLIVAVLLGGVPLTVLRRRRASGRVAQDEEGDDEES